MGRINLGGALRFNKHHDRHIDESFNTVDRKRELRLLAAWQQGDVDAFSELYNEHVDKVFRYIYYRVDDVSVAEDLTSEVFMRVLESLPGYLDRAAPLMAWIYRIAHARVIDYYRTNRFTSQHKDLAELSVETDHDLDQSLMDDYARRHVQSAIRRLTSEQQQVIILRFVEGNSIELTAQLLGKTVASIKSMQFRAVKTLTRLLKEQGFDLDGQRLS